MRLNSFFRSLIIGKDHYIESYPQFRQVILSGQLSVLCFAVCLSLAIVEFMNGNMLVVAIFLGTMAILAVSLYCHRLGKHPVGHYLFLVPTNILCYLMASSEDAHTGAFVHFISLIIAGFIIFGYQQRWAAVIFSAITFGLFFLSYFGNFSILPFRYYSADHMLIFRLVNFSTAAIACMVAIFLLVRVNHKNYVRLIENYHLLTKANAELDRFVYSTSHDLRAPLTSILGLLNIAEVSNHPQESKKYFGMMRDRIFTLDKFIRDITDYSRNNRVAVKFQKIRVHQLVHEIWEMVRYTPEARDVRFEVHIPENSEIETDVSRLKTVLLNLITNSVRYHDLRKAERYIRLRYQPNGTGFHIKVEDNGQGIDPAYHGRVFEMFFRANEKSHGSGLGLYIVKETIAKLSGTIQLESIPGEGSIFTVKLPA